MAVFCHCYFLNLTYIFVSKLGPRLMLLLKQTSPRSCSVNELSLGFPLKVLNWSFWVSIFTDTLFSVDVSYWDVSFSAPDPDSLNFMFKNFQRPGRSLDAEGYHVEGVCLVSVCEESVRAATADDDVGAVGRA